MEKSWNVMEFGFEIVWEPCQSVRRCFCLKQAGAGNANVSVLSSKFLAAAQIFCVYAQNQENAISLVALDYELLLFL